MLKKTVTYEDFDGNTRAETLYFFISKSELTEMELNTPGGFAKRLEKISTVPDGKEIMVLLKELILKAYGEKREDNGAFIKRRNGVELAEEFEQSLAFDALYTELLMNPNKAADFINGIWPKDMIEEAKKLDSQAKTSSLPSGNN